MTLETLSKLTKDTRIWYVFALSGVPGVAAKLVAASGVRVDALEHKVFVEWEDNGATCRAVLDTDMADRSIHLTLFGAKRELDQRLAEMAPPPGWS